MGDVEERGDTDESSSSSLVMLMGEMDEEEDASEEDACLAAVDETSDEEAGVLLPLAIDLNTAPVGLKLIEPLPSRFFSVSISSPRDCLIAIGFIFSLPFSSSISPTLVFEAFDDSK